MGIKKRMVNMMKILKKNKSKEDNNIIRYTDNVLCYIVKTWNIIHGDYPFKSEVQAVYNFFVNYGVILIEKDGAIDVFRNWRGEEREENPLSRACRKKVLFITTDNKVIGGERLEECGEINSKDKKFIRRVMEDGGSLFHWQEIIEYLNTKNDLLNGEIEEKGVLNRFGYDIVKKAMKVESALFHKNRGNDKKLSRDSNLTRKVFNILNSTGHRNFYSYIQDTNFWVEYKLDFNIVRDRVVDQVTWEINGKATIYPIGGEKYFDDPLDIIYDSLTIVVKSNSTKNRSVKKIQKKIREFTSGLDSKVFARIQEEFSDTFIQDPLYPKEIVDMLEIEEERLNSFYGDNNKNEETEDE